MNLLHAELLIFIDAKHKLFDFNVAYLRDGGEVNGGWESGGIFPCTHDALECGRKWLKDAQASGFKRGNRSNPRIWKAA
jgi:hypothetical protein